MQELFISFTSLLHQVTQDNFNPEVLLNDALFAFGCTREVVMDDEYTSKVTAYIPASQDDINTAVWIVRDAIERAEADGRITWRTRDEGNMSYDRLNRFLVAQGLRSLPVEHVYTYPRVTELMAVRNPSIAVRW